jgi:hypothetical protein
MPRHGIPEQAIGLTQASRGKEVPHVPRRPIFVLPWRKNAGEARPLLARISEND